MDNERDVKYVKSQNYFETYATGMWGGLNHEKMIQVTFFEEMLDIPDYSKVGVSTVDGNKVNHDKPFPEEPNRIRNAKCTITFKPEKLAAFIDWMEKIKTACLTNRNSSDE